MCGLDERSPRVGGPQTPRPLLHRRAAEARAPDPPPLLFVGDLIRYTGIFLKNTGQHTGPAGGQVFEVVPCVEGGRGDPRGQCNQCQDGLWVFVRDRTAGRHCRSSTHAIEVPARADAETRHIAVANVCRCEAIDPRNSP